MISRAGSSVTCGASQPPGPSRDVNVGLSEALDVVGVGGHGSIACARHVCKVLGQGFALRPVCGADRRCRFLHPQLRVGTHCSDSQARFVAPTAHTPSPSICKGLPRVAVGVASGGGLTVWCPVCPDAGGKPSGAWHGWVRPCRAVELRQSLVVGAYPPSLVAGEHSCGRDPYCACQA